MAKKILLKNKMKNRRFRKNEEAIIDVFLNDYKKGITVQKMAKKAGLGRTTIYIHHHATREIISDYHKYILAQYRKEIQKKLKKRDVPLKMLYFDMLIFILRNKKIFGMFLQFGNRDILMDMIKKMELKIVKFARLPKNSEKILGIYVSEVVELIFEWGKRGFSERELESILKDIMYLTETSRNRLMPISQ
ncbi:MAG: TetR/AcrR family transcriptional regulator [Candidatus Saccharibacteria bacterium]|nr:TetR/AcrR family transcriptional regulator [Candidatus Saccharibacteria bacterium]